MSDLSREQIDALWAQKDAIQINAEFQHKYDKAYDRNPELGFYLTKAMMKIELLVDHNNMDKADEVLVDLFNDVDSYYRLIICAVKGEN